MPELPDVTQDFVADVSRYIGGLAQATAAARAFAAAAREASGAQSQETASANAAIRAGLEQARAISEQAREYDILRANLLQVRDALASNADVWDVLRTNLQAVSTQTVQTNETSRGLLATFLAYAAALPLITAGTRGFGGVLGFATRQITLFAGVFGKGGLGDVAVWHVIIDSLAEVAAVVLPAAAAFGAFGAAAIGTAKEIQQRISADVTVMDALGKTIFPVTGGMDKLTAAIRPQVLQAFGDGISLVNQHMGSFSQLAIGTAHVVDDFAARIVVDARTGGSVLHTFLSRGVEDFRLLGQLLGNIGGIIGHVLAALPDFAQTFLRGAVAITGFLGKMAAAAQPLLNAALWFHGIWLWGGLAVTAIVKMIPVMVDLAKAAVALNVIVGTKAVLAFTLFMTALENGDGVMAGTQAAMIGLAGSFTKLGIFSGLAVAGLLAFIIVASSGASRMQQFADSIKKGVQGAPLTDLTALKMAQFQLNVEMSKGVGVQHNISEGWKALHGGMAAQISDTNALKGTSASLAQEYATVSGHLATLTQRYGSQQAALYLLNQAGIKTIGGLNVQGKAWAVVQQKVQAVANGYLAMAPSAGAAGQFLGVLTQQASEQYVQMEKLITAWDTFMSRLSGLEANLETVATQMHAVTQAARVQGASFDGLNSASLTLRTAFNQELIALNQVLDSMVRAHKSSRDLGEVISGFLKPAIDKGALSNLNFRNQIYAMAVEAGFHGVNSIKALKGWIDSFGTSAQQSAKKVDGVSSSLAKMPKSELINILLHGTATGSVSINTRVLQAGASARVSRSAPPAGGRATGGYVAGPGSGTSDSVPAWLSNGEYVMKAASVARYGTKMMDHINAGKFAGGGFIEQGNVWSHPFWGDMFRDKFRSQMVSTFTADLRSELNREMQAALAAGMAAARASGALMGGGGSGGPAGLAGLESLWIRAGGPASVARLMAAIAMAESGGNPRAFNPSGASGLWQILGLPFPGNPFDPLTNARMAVSKYFSQGLGAWVTYTSGAYRQFYDKGGVLPPGMTMAVNNTGRNEYVSTYDPHMGTGDLIVQIDGRELLRIISGQAYRYNTRNSGVRTGILKPT